MTSDQPNPCPSRGRAFLGFPEGGALLPCGGRTGHEGRHEFFMAWTDAGAEGTEPDSQCGAYYSEADGARYHCVRRHGHDGNHLDLGDFEWAQDGEGQS